MVQQVTHNQPFNNYICFAITMLMSINCSDNIAGKITICSKSSLKDQMLWTNTKKDLERPKRKSEKGTIWFTHAKLKKQVATRGREREALDAENRGLFTTKSKPYLINLIIKNWARPVSMPPVVDLVGLPYQWSLSSIPHLWRLYKKVTSAK